MGTWFLDSELSTCFFNIGSGKNLIGSGILTIIFLSQLSPVLQWAMNDVKFVTER